MPKSFKVEVLCYGETKYASNGLRFATEGMANLYAIDLESRWSSVDKWRIVESDDPANRLMPPYTEIPKEV